MLNPNRIIPDLQSSLICEDVRHESNGNFILVGIIGLIRVPQVPITVFKLCVFNRWTAGLGSFQERVKLVAPDQISVLRESQVKFHLEDVSHHATNVTFFGQIELARPGVYHFEVLVEDVMKLRFPLPVLVQPPNETRASAPSHGQHPG